MSKENGRSDSVGSEQLNDLYPFLHDDTAEPPGAPRSTSAPTNLLSTERDRGKSLDSNSSDGALGQPLSDSQRSEVDFIDAFSQEYDEAGGEENAEDKLLLAAQIGEMLMERNEEAQRRIEELDHEKVLMQKDLEDLRGERDQMRQDCDHYSEQIDDANYENKRLKMRLKDVESSYTQSAEHVLELKREIQHLNTSHLSEIEALESQKRVLEDTKTRSGKQGFLRRSSQTEQTDNSLLKDKNKRLDRRVNELQETLDQRTKELEGISLALGTAEISRRELERKMKEYSERVRDLDKFKKRSEEFEVDLKKNVELVDKLEKENSELSTRMEKMTIAKMHFEKKLDEETQLRSEESKLRVEQHLEIQTLRADSPRDPKTTSTKASASLMDELKAPEIAEDASPSSSTEGIVMNRDSNKEFFMLTCLATKVNLALTHRTDLSSLRGSDLFNLACERRTPFHHYQKFIEDEILKATKKKQRERERLLGQQQQLMEQERQKKGFEKFSDKTKRVLPRRKSRNVPGISSAHSGSKSGFSFDRFFARLSAAKREDSEDDSDVPDVTAVVGDDPAASAGGLPPHGLPPSSTGRRPPRLPPIHVADRPPADRRHRSLTLDRFLFNSTALSPILPDDPVETSTADNLAPTFVDESEGTDSTSSQRPHSQSVVVTKLSRRESMMKGFSNRVSTYFGSSKRNDGALDSGNSANKNKKQEHDSSNPSFGPTIALPD